MTANHLVLIGGGHSHSLILHRWRMKPSLKPKGLITLISTSSSTFYSGMLPGLVSKIYTKKQALINVHKLASDAGVSFLISEAIKIDPKNKIVFLSDRPSIGFDKLSINIGSSTYLDSKEIAFSSDGLWCPIRPIEHSFAFIEKQDCIYKDNLNTPFSVVGSGMSALEMVLALRTRWPYRPLRIHVRPNKIDQSFRGSLKSANIDLLLGDEEVSPPALLCKGNVAPKFLKESGFQVDSYGRILTHKTLQSLDYQDIFAVGDCAVVKDNFRPPSGVWAVRASAILAKNIEASFLQKPLQLWNPPLRALQLMGGRIPPVQKNLAWLFWGSFSFGPSHLLWIWKQFLDKRFVKKLDNFSNMQNDRNVEIENNDCRGCAAKLPAENLKNALETASLDHLACRPEDSAFVAEIDKSRTLFQSIDGFPALVSDPWLNGRLTALHACSDLWATGAEVHSAHTVITVPKADRAIQTFLLSQAIKGIQSALEPQSAALLGGHTIESRSISKEPISLDITISLAVNGVLKSNRSPWLKSGLMPGDLLFLSRKLGVGVVFAAAMEGKIPPHQLDLVMRELQKSQFPLFKDLSKLENSLDNNFSVNSSTDITGFGLLGHLGEMLHSSNYVRNELALSPLSATLNVNRIPFFDCVMDLFNQGCFSTLSKENKKFLELLEPINNCGPLIDLHFDTSLVSQTERSNYLDLMIDPQTCGPLLISCRPEYGRYLLNLDDWRQIGCINDI